MLRGTTHLCDAPPDYPYLPHAHNKGYQGPDQLGDLERFELDHSSILHFTLTAGIMHCPTESDNDGMTPSPDIMWLLLHL